MKLITVKKGNHLSNEITKPIFLKDNLKVRVKFTFDSMYDVGDEQLDWNKLLGRSWGFFPLLKSFMMHENSSRFGCRLNLQTGCYQATPYYYIKGKRYYAEILGIEPVNLDWYVNYIFEIIPNDNQVTYLITEEESNKIIFKFVAKQYIPSLMGWLAPFYFGGNAVADRDIKIYKTYIK